MTAFKNIYLLCDSYQQNTDEQQVPAQNVPDIEPIENELVREVWSTPRASDSIQMDNDRAQQVKDVIMQFAYIQLYKKSTQLKLCLLIFCI